MYQWICDWYLNGEMVNMAGNKYRRLTLVALDFCHSFNEQRKDNYSANPTF